MTRDELASYAREKMYDAMGWVMNQSTTNLTLSEILELMGVPKLVEIASKETQ